MLVTGEMSNVEPGLIVLWWWNIELSISQPVVFSLSSTEGLDEEHSYEGDK